MKIYNCRQMSAPIAPAITSRTSPDDTAGVKKAVVEQVMAPSFVKIVLQAMLWSHLALNTVFIYYLRSIGSCACAKTTLYSVALYAIIGSSIALALQLVALYATPRKVIVIAPMLQRLQQILSSVGVLAFMIYLISIRNCSCATNWLYGGLCVYFALAVVFSVGAAAKTRELQ